MIAELLLLFLIVTFMVVGIAVIIYPPRSSYKPPDPASWSDESLWHGERSVHASFAIIEVENKWAAGFLYLTNFRLVWLPGHFYFYQGYLPSKSVRLARIRRVQKRGGAFRQPRIEVETPEETLLFCFVLYLKPLIATGDPKGHIKWLQHLAKAPRP